MALRRVHLVQRGKVLPREGAGQAHYGRPEPAMYVGDLPAYEATDQDLLGVANRTGEPKDLVTLGVAPPAAADRASDHGLGQVGDGSARAFEDDPVAPDESEGSFRGHWGVDCRRSLTARA